MILLLKKPFLIKFAIYPLSPFVDIRPLPGARVAELFGV